jgi:hypothetical protein
MGAKNQDEILNKLREWLETNSSATLAAKLGYKNSSTVSQWLTRKSIPRWVVPDLKKIIGGK